MSFDRKAPQVSPPNARQQGFSLVELVVTVAVLAIVGSIAIPSFRQMQMNSRLTATTNELNAVLQGARMDAVKTNGRVEVCPSSDGSTCSGNDWKRIIVLAHKNGASNVLRDVAFAGADIEINASSNISSEQKIWYQADGLVRMGSASAPSQQGTLAVCIKDMSGQNARNVQVQMGRVSVTRATSAGCGIPGN